MRTKSWLLVPIAALLSVIGCKDDEKPALTREQLLDPQSCKSCHPIHYREWASSMHAYAADDPVFLAMNRRGQEETDGELGDFCVDCHAPMAVRENKISDFAEVQDVPQHLKGVTCYFCHNAIEVGEPHNNDITLANDNVMRGGIKNPVRTTAHAAEYSEFHDRYNLKSSRMCGGCHDVQTTLGAHIERTYAEWEGSHVANLPLAQGRQGCQNCHMHGRPGVVAEDPDAPVVERTLSGHLFAGVDLALTDFPDRDIQRLAIECELANSIRITLQLNPEWGPGSFRVTLETNAGHNQPSGAAQDRRMWLEFVAYDAAGNVLSGSSGRVEDGQPEDPNAWTLRDHLYGEDGEEVHMFWEAASFEAGTLPPATKTLPGSNAVAPHWLERRYDVSPSVQRVTARLRIRPMGFDVLQDLIDSEHLSASILDDMPTFTIYGTEVEWTDERGTDEITGGAPPLDCPDDYLCLLEPGSVYCRE